MNIYHYDAQTGAFLWVGDADPSPLDPPGTFLVPAHATSIEPPVEKTGFVRVYAAGAWGYVPENQLDAEPTPEPAVTTAMVNAERDRRIAAGFFFNLVWYDFDERAKANLAGAAQLAFMAIVAGAQPGDLFWNGGEVPFTWIAAHNDLVEMDAQTVVQFGRTATQHEQAHIFAGRALKDMSSIPYDFTQDSYWP